MISYEKRGKPAIGLVNKGFINDGLSAASSRGYPGIRMVATTIPCEANDLKVIAEAVDLVIEEIIAGLTRPLTKEEESPKSRELEKPTRIIFKGSLEEVNQFFYRRGWGDGLPLRPPTEEAVAEMLTGTDLAPEYSLGKLIPRLGKITIEKMAINAVMAGALPTYMPVLIAAVKALLNPKASFDIWEVSTGSWAPFWTINGPIRQDIHINSGTGAFSPGDMANAAIGRAIQLIVKNIGGARKGHEDMGIYGNPGKYSMVIAENEEESPWESLHVERGFKKEDSVLSVSFPHCFDTLVPMGSTDESVLKSYENYLGWGMPHMELCIVMLAAHAQTLARKGWSKKDFKAYIMEKRAVTPSPRGIGPLQVIIAGGPGNLLCATRGGAGVAQKIELPANWSKLAAKYKNLVPTYARY